TSILGPAAIAWLLLIEIFGRNSTRITRWPPSRHGATLTSANRATTPTDATSANAHSGGLRAVTGGQGQCLAAQRELARDCPVCISIHDVWLEQRTLLPLRACNLIAVSAGCHRMGTRTTMTDMATVYRRPVSAMRHSVKPQLASWDRAAHPSQVKLRRFLAHVDAV